MRTIGTGCVVFLFSFHAAVAMGGQPVACEDLQRLNLPGTVVMSTELVDADETTGWPAHCLAEGTVEGRIRFRAQLPVAADWNGRFMMGGGGGFVGNMQNQALGVMPGAGGDALTRGYATIGTDTGHRGHPPETAFLDASWALDNLPGIKDWGYRAVPKVAETGQRLVEAHYGRPASHNYFLGCSNGGRQALKLAQLDPHLFDGIVAIAPAIDWTGVMLGHLAIARAMFPDGKDQGAVLSAEDVQALNAAVNEHCDGLDGLADGIVSDPGACDFDPRTALPDFSEAQLRAVEAVYGGVEIDGRRFHPGFPPGSEATAGAWDMWLTGSATPQWLPGMPAVSVGSRFAMETFRYLAANDPGLELTALEPGAELVEELRFVSRIASATNPDLGIFRDSGGKLLITHGMADHALPVGHSTDYHQRVAERMGEDVDDFMRLFLLPGVVHCLGGDGPDRIDLIAAIEAWVEENQAPQSLAALKFDGDGEVTMARPVCAYPMRQQHDGEGDPASSESFVCEP